MDFESALFEYLFWNECITRRFFGEHCAGRYVKIAFDASVLEALAAANNRSGEDFLAALRELLRADSEENVFSFFTSRIDEYAVEGEPPYIGLLAACVLVASQMGEKNAFHGTAYWPPFNETILNRSASHMPHGYQHLRDFWRKAEHFFNIERNGALGFLRLPENPENFPLLHKGHINFPLSQCLIRELDKRDLNRLFERSPEIPNDISADDLFFYVESTRQRESFSFTVPFKNLLSQAAQDSNLRHEAALDILEVFTNRSDWQHRHSSRSIGARHRDHGIQTNSRLHMKRDGNIELQYQGAAGWENYGVVDSAEIQFGMSKEIDEAAFQWDPSPVTIFYNTEDFGYVTDESAKALPLNDWVRILADAESFENVCTATAVFNAQRPNNYHTRDVPLDHALSDMRCLAFYCDAAASSDEFLLSTLRMRSAELLTVELQGGIKWLLGTYYKGAPPSVIVHGSLPGDQAHSLRIDGVVFKTIKPGVLVDLPRDLEAGAHVIECAEASVSLRIADVDDIVDLSGPKEHTVGYILTRSPASMRTAIDPDLSAISAEHAMVLIGGELHGY